MWTYCSKFDKIRATEMVTPVLSTKQERQKEGNKQKE